MNNANASKANVPTLAFCFLWVSTSFHALRGMCYQTLCVVSHCPTRRYIPTFTIGTHRPTKQHFLIYHSCEGRNPYANRQWIPAKAGMTFRRSMSFSNRPRNQIRIQFFQIDQRDANKLPMFAPHGRCCHQLIRIPLRVITPTRR